MKRPEDGAALLKTSRVRLYRKKLWKFLREWLAPLAAEVVILYLAIQYLFFLAIVPTGSMLPAIHEKSWLFVTRMYRPEESVDRGDILVFQSDELHETLIKRVVGLPGDRVTLEEGRLYINGVYWAEPYVEYPLDFSGEWEVPPSCYFFMGDNRADSYDARYWRNPFIRAEEIEGKARFILWPPVWMGPLR